MRFQKFRVALLVCCLLLLGGCSQVTPVTALAEQWDEIFEDILENLSVRSVEKNNQSLVEPEFITWHTARHYYDTLSEKEKLAYRCIYNNIFAQPERIAIPLLKSDELEAVFSALQYDNPQLLFFGDNAAQVTAGVNFYFVPEYTLSYPEARKTIEAVADNAQQALTLLSPHADDYTVLLTLHDYLCEGCDYADGGSASQCHGALLEGYATCTGYSKALKLLLDIAGMDSCIVTGDATEDGTDLNHMWLAVSLQGAWYFCDPTWDDPVSDDGLQTVEHGYFAVSESRLSLTHSSILKPEHIVCDSEEYDYFLIENLFCTQENYLSVIADGIEKALRNNKSFAEYRFESLNTLQTAAQMLIDEGAVYDLLYEVSFLREDLLVNRIGYAVDEKRLQLKLIFAFEE